jgi:hypothetical protein
VNDILTNKNRAINIISIPEKEIKKYKLVKNEGLFLKDDLISLYDDQYVKVSESSKLLKYKINKDNTVYRKK